MVSTGTGRSFLHAGTVGLEFRPDVSIRLDEKVATWSTGQAHTGHGISGRARHAGPAAGVPGPPC